MVLLRALLGCDGSEAPVLPAVDGAVSAVSAATEDTDTLRALEAADVLIPGVPHVVQRPDFCGEACVEMAARHFGLDLSQDDVFDASGLDPSLGRGVYARELKATLEDLGFDPGEGFFPMRDAERQFSAMIADLRAGVPSILCVHSSDRPDASEHFILVIGYDSTHDVFVYHDPGGPDGAYNRLSRAHLLSRWHLAGSAGPTLIRLRVAPVSPRSVSRAEGYRPADYMQVVHAARARVHGEPFYFAVAPPFVIVGDDDGEVRDRAERTVRFAADGLRRNHFDRDPERIYTAWLFSDDASYMAHAKAIFGDEPDTPYGYTDGEEAALVMNISTGGGTLIHEMVHAYLHAEMPNAPPWFNEGLASLYEGTEERDGTIRGTVNWRLPELQDLIRADMLPDFPTLMALDTHGFYSGESGLYYAQARYLCYWLQEHGLIERFYRDFRAAQHTDPTGVVTLRRTLGTDDLDTWQVEWQKWVLTLRFAPE